MITKYQFTRFQLLMGEHSKDIFHYFNVEEMHGLSLKEAEAYPETKHGAYIWGWCNYSPIDGDMPFLFLNKTRWQKDYTDVTGIMHETMHLALLLHNWDIENKEEEIISDAENIANEIVKLIKFHINII